ncbi:MAG TPA: hypothetical protein VFT64_10795 [Rickettsiales bacterium]|nr:hypothetical protein [Rickettsiales bacterium]
MSTDTATALQEPTAFGALETNTIYQIGDSNKYLYIKSSQKNDPVNPQTPPVITYYVHFATRDPAKNMLNRINAESFSMGKDDTALMTGLLNKIGAAELRKAEPQREHVIALNHPQNYAEPTDSDLDKRHKNSLKQIIDSHEEDKRGIPLNAPVKVEAYWQTAHEDYLRQQQAKTEKVETDTTAADKRTPPPPLPLPDTLPHVKDEGTGPKKLTFSQLESGVMYPTGKNRTFLYIEPGDSNHTVNVYTYSAQATTPVIFDIEVAPPPSTAQSPAEARLIKDNKKQLAKTIQGLEIYEPDRRLSPTGEDAIAAALPRYVMQAYLGGVKLLPEEERRKKVASNAERQNQSAGSQELWGDIKGSITGQPRLVLATDKSGRLLAGIVMHPGDSVEEWAAFDTNTRKWTVPEKDSVKAEDVTIVSPSDSAEYIKTFKQQAGVTLTDKKHEGKPSLFDIMFSEESIGDDTVKQRFTPEKIADHLRQDFKDRYSVEAPPAKDPPESSSSPSSPIVNANINGNLDTKHELNMGKGTVAFAAIAGTALLGAVGIGAMRAKNAPQTPATQQDNGQNPQAEQNQKSWINKIAPLGLAAAAVTGAALLVAKSNSNSGGQSR